MENGGVETRNFAKVKFGYCTIEGNVMSRPIHFVRDVDEYLSRQLPDSTKKVVCCTGSLYLCGDLLNALHWEEQI